MKHALFLLLLPAALPALTRQEFLEQVAQGNKALAAARGSDAALKLAALEPEAMLSPYLNASLQYYEDQAEPLMPFSPQRTASTQLEASLSQQLAFSGTRLSLGFKQGSNALQLPPGFFGPGAEPFYALSHGLSVGLQQPLLRDAGARGYRVAKRRALAASASARMMNRMAAAAVVLEAQGTYSGLASLQAINALLEESLERNRKILEWTRSKYADNLVDKVDVLQVEAALKQVEGGLAQTRSEAARSVEKFNALRGRPLGEDPGALELPLPPSELPGALGERLEVEAQKQALLGSEALVDEVKERFTPELTLFGSATATGSDLGAPAGASPDDAKTWDFDHPTYVVGMKLSTTLDLPLYRKVIQGARLGVGQGADELASRRQKAEQEWASLKGQWAALSEQLRLAEELEKVQQEKAEREKRRYQDGRTSNFQVLRFEEDYNQARIQTLRLRAQAWLLKAQADFYNGGGIQW